jgi:hypothetical protein
VTRETVAVRFGVVAASLGLAVAACSQEAAAPVAAECVLQIRFDGVIYDGWVTPISSH